MKKKIFLSVILVAFVLIGLAQVPDVFNYQAVVRNNSGEVVANQSVSFRLSILQGSETGTVMYAETHSVSTNNFGLINLKVGNGTLVSGVFSPGGWGATSHFLKVEIDPAGGSTFSHLGTSELLAVPYAFHAKTVEDDAVDDADASPTNEIQTLSLSGSELSLSEGGGTVTLPAPGAADNWGTQTVESDATLSGNGTSGDPLGVVGDLTDDQSLSIVGDDLSISEGNTVTLPGDDWGTQTVVSEATLSGNGTSGDPLGVVGDLTDDQTLSLSGNDLSISNGNSVTLASSVWSTNGTRAFYNGGNVGIGTSDPSRLLTLRGTNTGYLGLYNEFTGTTSNDGLLVGLASENHHAYLWNYENGPLRFGTNNTLRVLVDADGNVGFGTDNPDEKIDVHGGTGNSFMTFHNNATGDNFNDGMFLGINSGGTDAYIRNLENGPIFFGTNGTTRMVIQSDGAVTIGHPNMDPLPFLLSVNGPAAKPGGGSWTNWSDRRLKDLHGSYEKGLSEIVALQPVVFNYKDDNPLDLPSDNEEVGLIAQEVREIFPEAVSLCQNGYFDFNMHPINVAFVNAFKELKAANDDLKEQVNELESRLEEIEKMIKD